MIICGRDELIAHWVANQLDTVDSFGECTAIGIATETKIIAGCVYHNYRPKYGSIEMSIASMSPMWAKKENVRFLLSYPFEQLDCYRVYACIELENERAKKTVGHIGFTQEAICHSLFGKGNHGAIYRMLRPDFIKLYGDVECQKTHPQPQPR